MRSKLKKLFAFCAASLAFALVLAECSPAQLPLMSRDVSVDFDLTSPYSYMDGSYPKYIDVNPPGISIKQTRRLSNGATEITLGGNAVFNGIPAALHEVNYNPTPSTYAYLRTDYPKNILTGGSPIPIPPLVTTQRPIENSFSLGTVSRNSKYTAVTISGMVQDKNFVDIIEENESLRLFSQYYITSYNRISSHFNPSRTPMLKELVYYNPPNYFSDNGSTPVTLLYRGPNSAVQKGGFNVLIWDGANPKRANYKISYDGGKTYSTIIVDWNNVTFAEEQLTNVTWQNTPKYTDDDTVNTGYKVFDSTNCSLPTPSGTLIKVYTLTMNTALSEWYGDDIIRQYPLPDHPPPDSRIEGLQPLFVPANASNKYFYFTEDDATQTGYDPAADGFPGLGPFGAQSIYASNGGINYAKVELQDRLRITALQGVDVTGPTTCEAVYLVIPCNSATTTRTVLKIIVKVNNR
ncbi:MAG: hypothetical protein LBG79_05230 [Spirochaetaceae bacterium]|jgi:hypothetical protein|nr:hypothetical protein [Spirochaetaceae bacterium]